MQKCCETQTIVQLKDAMKRNIAEKKMQFLIAQVKCDMELKTPNAGKTAPKLIVVSDPDRDCDDEIAMCVLASLTRTESESSFPPAEIVAAIATLEPAKDRGRLFYCEDHWMYWD